MTLSQRSPVTQAESGRSLAGAPLLASERASSNNLTEGIDSP